MKKSLDKFFGRLASLRGKDSVSAFARRIGIPQQTMDRYLHGRVPSLEIFVLIATQVGVSTDWLLGFTDARTGTAAPVMDAESASRIAELEREVGRLRAENGGLRYALDALGRVAVASAPPAVRTAGIDA